MIFGLRKKKKGRVYILKCLIVQSLFGSAQGTSMKVFHCMDIPSMFMSPVVCPSYHYLSLDILWYRLKCNGVYIINSMKCLVCLH